MGQDEDDLNASIAHVILSCVAGRGISSRSSRYAQPGMHANFFIHGIIGFMHYQSGKFNNDFARAYVISYRASKYLALPCLMADLYRGNDALSVLHLASGILPFALSLSEKDNVELGSLMIACNIISLCYYSFEHNREWGWFTAGSAIFAYFLAPQMGPKIMYPLGLALMEYCAYRVSSVRIETPS
ncbi:uncharacterized protein [Battus philenor]|uniref:uncharacterized protein n=1 Tax=Battus philenor TaxID=42288 RepID=UPI0035D02010